MISRYCHVQIYRIVFCEVDIPLQVGEICGEFFILLLQLGQHLFQTLDLLFLDLDLTVVGNRSGSRPAKSSTGSQGFPNVPVGARVRATLALAS